MWKISSFGYLVTNLPIHKAGLLPNCVMEKKELDLKEQKLIFRIMHTKYIQSTYKVHTEYIQSTYKVHTEYIQSTYRVHTEYIQSTYRVHTEYIQSTYSTSSKKRKEGLDFWLDCYILD